MYPSWKVNNFSLLNVLSTNWTYLNTHSTLLATNRMTAWKEDVRHLSIKAYFAKSGFFNNLILVFCNFLILLVTFWHKKVMLSFSKLQSIKRLWQIIYLDCTKIQDIQECVSFHQNFTANVPKFRTYKSVFLWQYQNSGHTGVCFFFTKN